MPNFILRFLGRLVLVLIPGPDPRTTLRKWAEEHYPATGKRRITPREPAPVINSWSAPWTTPQPEHVIKRHQAFEDNLPLVRGPYRAYLERQEKAQRVHARAQEMRQQQRRQAELLLASLGLDYPGTPLRGAPQAP